MVERSKPRSIYTMLHGSSSHISCICNSQENEKEHGIYEDGSEYWNTDRPPKTSLSWRRSFSQLRRQWSDHAKKSSDENTSTHENMDEKNASFPSDMEELSDNDGPIVIRHSYSCLQSNESMDDNPTLGCNYGESFADRSEDSQGMTEEDLQEISPQVECLLRRSSMSDEEKRVVVDNLLRKILLDPAKRDSVARSIMRRSFTTVEEMKDTLIYSIKRNSAKLEEKRSSVRAIVEALHRDENVRRKTLRFIFSKEPAQPSFAESDSFQKIQDEVWVLAKESKISNDITRVKIESILRSSTLTEDEKELIIDRVLRKNVLDSNVRNIFRHSMRMRSRMTSEERNHNIVKLLECMILPSAQKSDIITAVLEDYPSDYHSRDDLNQYNVESAINALTFHRSSAHNFGQKQEKGDFQSSQTKLGSQEWVKSQSESKFKPFMAVESCVSGEKNHCERHKPVCKNMTQEFNLCEIEQNPVRNPTSYQVYQVRNTRIAKDTSKYSDLKLNLFPENYIYNYSTEKTGQYKKSRFCENPTCAVKLRKEPRKPDSVLKEFFHEMAYDHNEFGGGIPDDTCSCTYVNNENRCLHGEPCNCDYENQCRQLKEKTYIEHEIFVGQQLENVASGTPIQVEHKKSVPSQRSIRPDDGKYKSSQFKSLVYTGNKPSQQETRSKLGNNSQAHLSRSKVSISDLFSRGKSSSRKINANTGSEADYKSSSRKVNANTGSEPDYNHSLRTELSRATFYDEDKHDGKTFYTCNKSCGSCCSDRSRCHSRNSSERPSKCVPQHSVNNEPYSNDSFCRALNEDCTLCLCVVITKYLYKKWRELFSMQTLCRLLQLISFLGRFMWLPILIALIWSSYHKQDNPVRCFVYCRKC